jgi:hypothetical protein
MSNIKHQYVDMLVAGGHVFIHVKCPKKTKHLLVDVVAALPD